MTDTQWWSDERIIAEAEAIAARCADWRDTRWAAQNTLRQIRDDMAQEIAALKQELASALTEMLEVVEELGRDEAHVKFRRRVLRGRITELTGKEWGE